MKRQGRHFKVAKKSERVGPRGITYRSKMERKFAQHLEAIRASDPGMSWEYEPSISLVGIVYKPDFSELLGQQLVCYHEIKSFRRWVSPKTGKVAYRPIDKRWPTIKKLWKLYGPAILKVWTLERKTWKLVETIKPPEDNLW